MDRVISALVRGFLVASVAVCFAVSSAVAADGILLAAGSAPAGFTPNAMPKRAADSNSLQR